MTPGCAVLILVAGILTALGAFSAGADARGAVSAGLVALGAAALLWLGLFALSAYGRAWAHRQHMRRMIDSVGGKSQQESS